MQEKKYNWKLRVLEILITAILSAAIAFFQSLLTQHGGFNNPVADPEVAGAIGAALRTSYIFVKPKIC